MNGGNVTRALSLRMSGQALVEYALISSMIGLVLIVGWMMYGERVAEIFDSVTEELTSRGVEVSWAPEPTAIEDIHDDFRDRTLDYFEREGRWPRTRYPQNYTDLGLNPDDWSAPVEGILWIPRGSVIRLRNMEGDNIQVYVNDMNGNTLHLYDGWNIHCPVTEDSCYYHTIDPGNEVDISTIQIVEE